jgi:DNA-binding GntR family transcriptional regulator
MTTEKKTRRPQRTVKVPVEKRSLSQQAYQLIRDEILRGDLSIGDILSRRSLADRLNMSFLPVTEALERLEAERLVESKPRIGTRVRIPKEQDILNSYVIREALESQAARLCAEHIDPSEKELLHSSARRLDELHELCQTDTADPSVVFSFHNHHMKFHMRIAELSGCPGLRDAIEKEHILVFNWVWSVAARRQTQPPEFHTKLAIALCSGSTSMADRTMRGHVRYGLSEVLDWVANFSQEDKWREKSGKVSKAAKSRKRSS